MAKESKTGACRFCGQSIIVEGGADMTAPQLEEAATMACECEKAMAYKETKTRRETAKQRVEELFGDASEEKQPEAVRKIILDVVDSICDKKMKSATITVREGLKCRVMQMAKDKIKVVREMSANDEFTQ